MKSLREQAMDFLAQREHSTSELQRKLRAKGFAIDEINTVMRQLTKDGLQSDERFAEQFVQSRRRHGFGPHRIALELEQRGIAPELIEEHVWLQAEKWRDCLQEVINRRYGASKVADMKEKAKRMRFLMQRGFNVEEIREMLL